MSTTEQTTPTAARRQVSPSKAEVSEARALSKEVGLEYVDLDRYPLNAAATSLLPEQASRRQHALAIGWKYGTPVVAVARPDNLMTMDDLRTIIGRDIHAVVACESQIDAYIERMYARVEAPGTGHARPAAQRVRKCREDSVRLAVRGRGASASARATGARTVAEALSVGEGLRACEVPRPSRSRARPAGRDTAPADPAPAPRARAPAAPEPSPHWTCSTRFRRGTPVRGE